VISTYLLFYLVVVLLYLQTMESGTTSAMRGRIPLDHGSCTKMARLRLLVEASIQVKYSTLDSFYSVSLPNGDFCFERSLGLSITPWLSKSSHHFTEQNNHCNRHIRYEALWFSLTLSLFDRNSYDEKDGSQGYHKLLWVLPQIIFSFMFLSLLKRKPEPVT